MIRKLLIVLGLVFTIGISVSEAVQSPPFIKIISPNGGESLELGSAYKMKWRSAGIGSVMLYLTLPDGRIMATNLENVKGNPESAYVVVANHIPIGSYKVFIIGCAIPSACTYDQRIAEDISDSPFSIITPPIPIITQKASWYRPDVINSVVNNMEYFMRDYAGPAEYRILIESGIRTEGRIRIENYNLADKTLKIYCPDGNGVIHSSEQQTIDFEVSGAKLVIEDCTIQNDYVPDPNQPPYARWANAAILATWGPSDVELRRNHIESLNTNGVSMNYVGCEVLVGNTINAPRIGVFHSNMSEILSRWRKNNQNIIKNSAITHFFNNVSVYPLPNDIYINVAVGGAITTTTKGLPTKIKDKFSGELW